MDLTGFHDINIGVGCTGHSMHAFIRTLIVKTLEHVKSIPRLIDFLEAHPILTQMCGFDIGNLPDSSQFYPFLAYTKNSDLEKIHQAVNKKLSRLGIITRDVFILVSGQVNIIG